MPANHAGERSPQQHDRAHGPDNTTKENIMNTTVGSRRARLVRNTIAGLALAATVGTLAACGDESSDAPTQSPSARAVAAAQGSDRHLELKAAEVFRAEQRQADLGSDRHLELKAGEIFRSVERRQQAAYGSDRHLELKSEEIFRSVERRPAVGVYTIPSVERRSTVGVYTIPNVEQAANGSDRHLEQLAKDIVARAQWARRSGG
jgi:hypothetical protein